MSLKQLKETMASPSAPLADNKSACCEPPQQDFPIVSEVPSAYAWFYRLRRRGPGCWKHAQPAQAITMIKYLKKRRVESVPVGVVWSPNTLNNRYEYICIRVAIPETTLEELNHV